MTRQKHLKDHVRARMQKTGQRYTVARRHILAKATPLRIREILSELSNLESSAAEHFPLGDDECDELRAALKQRVSTLHLDEVAAHQRIGEVLAMTV